MITLYRILVKKNLPHLQESTLTEIHTLRNNLLKYHQRNARFKKQFTLRCDIHKHIGELIKLNSKYFSPNYELAHQIICSYTFIYLYFFIYILKGIKGSKVCISKIYTYLLLYSLWNACFIYVRCLWRANKGRIIS